MNAQVTAPNGHSYSLKCFPGDSNGQSVARLLPTSIIRLRGTHFPPTHYLTVLPNKTFAIFDTALLLKEFKTLIKYPQTH